MTETPDGDLKDEVRALREELTHLREHKMVILYQSPMKVVFFRFVSGMAVGLGTVIGASMLLSIFIWALSTIEFIPIIGEWSVMLADEIQTLMTIAPEQ